MPPMQATMDDAHVSGSFAAARAAIAIAGAPADPSLTDGEPVALASLSPLRQPQHDRMDGQHHRASGTVLPHDMPHTAVDAVRAGATHARPTTGAQRLADCVPNACEPVELSSLWSMRGQPQDASMERRPNAPGASASRGTAHAAHELDPPDSPPPGGEEVVALSHLACRREHFQSEQMVRLCDPEAPARWMADRASGQWSSNAKPGTSDAARAARTVARGLTFTCTATGCSALVDLQSARRQAGAAGRTRLLPGDGCSSRQCAAFFKPRKVARRQNAMAAGLKAATRWLVRWNRRLDAKKVLVCSGAETFAAADAAVAALAAASRSRRKPQPPEPATVSPAPASPARMLEPAAGIRKRSSQLVLRLRGGGGSTQGDEICCTQQEASEDFDETAQLLRVVGGEPCSWQAVEMPSAGAPLLIGRGASGLDLADGQLGSAGGSLVHSQHARIHEGEGAYFLEILGQQQ